MVASLAIAVLNQSFINFEDVCFLIFIFKEFVSFDKGPIDHHTSKLMCSALAHFGR